MKQQCQFCGAYLYQGTAGPECLNSNCSAKIAVKELRIECEHGQLKRQCPLCEKDEEIERLRAENQRQMAALEVARKHISGKAEKFSERERTPVLFQINEALGE